MMKTVQSIPPDGSTSTPSHFPHLSHLPHIAKKQRKLTMEEHLSQLYPVWDDVLELYEKHRKSELAIRTWCFWRFFHEAEKILERYNCRYQDLSEYDQNMEMAWWQEQCKDRPHLLSIIQRGHVEEPSAEMIQSSCTALTLIRLGLNLSLIHIWRCRRRG